MALEAGSVVVADDGTHTGSGLALAMYEARAAALASSYLGEFIAENPTFLRDLNRWDAIGINATASALVAYLTAHAAVSVTVGTGTAGMQRMPAATTENTPTKAPAAPVVLTGTIE